MTFEYDKEELTIYYAGTLYFLKGKYKNGYVLGWHSDNPCGCQADGDTGWAVFDPKSKTIIDSIETKMCHTSCSEGWRSWISELKEQYGRLFCFRRDDGQLFWNMSRDT